MKRYLNSKKVLELERNSKVDNVEKAIREKLESMTGFADESTQAFKLSALFKKFDKDRSGKISKVEFEEAMEPMNLVGRQTEIRQLFERYDVDDTGSLTYQEFVEQLVGLKANPKGDPFSRSVLERVRERVAERGGLNGIRTLGVLFRIMDDNRSKWLSDDEFMKGNTGMISHDEFMKGMNEIGVSMSAKDFTQLCKIFDKNGDGRIIFDEFLRALRPKMSLRRQHFVDLAFGSLDKDGSGKVELAELAETYDCSQHPEVLKGAKTERQVIREFSYMFDEETAPDGVITAEEFMNYYKDVSASVDSDDYFELMMRNAWHISGGEGALQNTSNIRVCVEHNDGSQEVGFNKIIDEYLRAQVMATVDAGVQLAKEAALRKDTELMLARSSSLASSQGGGGGDEYLRERFRIHR
jgi:Ca2+-binding EF-hand superfamily protein